MPYILALDQGTTSSRAIVFDAQAQLVGMAQREFTQIYPQAGWVEHNADEIWATQVAVAAEVLAKCGLSPTDIAAIGITNQRETTVVWDRTTGKPIHNAIVWQDRRTAAICETLRADAWEMYVKQNTGLVIDAYFSGTKVKWLLDNVPDARAKAERGELLFGTDRYVAHLEVNGRRGSCNGLQQCLADVVFQHQYLAMGRKITMLH